MKKYRSILEELNEENLSLLKNFNECVNRAVREVLSGKRSMVFSRSTFAGSGKYSGHWLGDNFSTWKNMADSIVGLSAIRIFTFEKLLLYRQSYNPNLLKYKRYDGVQHVRNPIYWRRHLRIHIQHDRGTMRTVDGSGSFLSVFSQSQQH